MDCLSFKNCLAALETVSFKSCALGSVQSVHRSKLPGDALDAALQQGACVEAWPLWSSEPGDGFSFFSLFSGKLLHSYSLGSTRNSSILMFWSSLKSICMQTMYIILTGKNSIHTMVGMGAHWAQHLEGAVNEGCDRTLAFHSAATGFCTWLQRQALASCCEVARWWREQVETSGKVRCDWLLCLTQLLAVAFCYEGPQDVVETVDENLWRS